MHERSREVCISTALTFGFQQTRGKQVAKPMGIGESREWLGKKSARDSSMFHCSDTCIGERSLRALFALVIDHRCRCSQTGVDKPSDFPNCLVYGRYFSSSQRLVNYISCRQFSEIFLFIRPFGQLNLVAVFRETDSEHVYYAE